MSKVPFPLGMNSYESESLPLSSQRCVNLYAVVPHVQALNKTALVGTPGITQFATAGTSSSRGATLMSGVYYVVGGGSLYAVDNSYSATTQSQSRVIGPISGTGRVSMAHNTEKLVIVVPGGNAYEYNRSNDQLHKITDPNFLASDTVVYKDGYFIFSQTTEAKFFVSGLSVGSNLNLTFNALDFSTAEQSPDRIVALHASFGELYVLGESTIEPFRNVGGANFPFSRLPGGTIEKGCHAKHSPIEWNNSFYFIGGGINERSSIWRSGGNQRPVKISTEGIDNELQKFNQSEISEGFSFSYSLNGSSFIGFTIQSFNIPSRTFVYNVSATEAAGRPVWFEQQSGQDTNRWRINSLTNVYEKLLVSDDQDGRIGFLDPQVYTEYGNLITREKTTSPLSDNQSSILVHQIELTMETGVGANSGRGTDPVVSMHWSDDGSRTWSSEIQRRLGKIGQYKHIVSWRRLGRVPRNRVFRFRVTDPVKVIFIKLEMDADVA